MKRNSDIFAELEDLLSNSYAPFSRFSVASIVVTRDDRIFKGVNVESAAFPTTICAERNAIFNAVTNGCRPGDISEVHILAKDSQGSLFPAYPCGSCRQVIAEQSLGKAKIFVHKSSEECTQTDIKSLLPEAFMELK